MTTLADVAGDLEHLGVGAERRMMISTRTIPASFHSRRSPRPRSPPAC